jgi:flavin-dependent dehydrogenase
MQLLLAQAHDAGVEVVTGHRFQGIARPAPIPLLCFENGRGPRHEEASTIIGADGVNSRVAESMERNGIERVSIVQARVELPADLPSGTVRIWFDRGLTRFFIWLIPESGGTGAAGLVAETEAAAEAALDRFLSAENLEPMAYQKAWVPLYSPGQRPSRSLGRGRAILVGDAASQVKVTTVGGMMTGMRGAQAAARSLLRGTSYASEMAPLRRELEAHALVRRVLDQFTDDDYDRLLRRLDQRGRQVLGRFSRDELTRSLWRLLLAQPGWLTLGARALLRGLTRNLKHS